MSGKGSPQLPKSYRIPEGEFHMIKDSLDFENYECCHVYTEAGTSLSSLSLSSIDINESDDNESEEYSPSIDMNECLKKHIHSFKQVLRGILDRNMKIGQKNDQFNNEMLSILKCCKRILTHHKPEVHIYIHIYISVYIHIHICSYVRSLIYM
jgi:hypothetical protein